MATLQEMSAKDFEAFKNDKIVSNEYNSLAEKEQKKYESDYKTKFSEEVKKLRSQIIDREHIDSKSAGQIILKEIKQAHEQGNYFMNSSGSVDAEKFNHIKAVIVYDVESGRYDNLIQRNQKEDVAIVNETENKIIDLNTPEGKKEFIDNLYKGYSDCKTKKDKINYIKENFCISLEGMSDEQVSHVVDAWDLRNDIKEIIDELKEKNPNLKEDELENLAEKQYAESNNQDLETVKSINYEMKELEDLLIENNKTEKKDKDIENKINEKIIKLSLSNDVSKKIEAEVLEKISNEKDIQSIDFESNLEFEDNAFENLKKEEFKEIQDIDVIDFFDMEENDKSDSELNGNSNTTIEEKINNLQINKSVNSIISNVPEEDFEQNYTEEYKENPVLSFLKNMKNRLTQKKLTDGQVLKTQDNLNELKEENYTQNKKTTFFERLKNTLSKLIHINKKSVLQLDTAENNTKTVYEDTKSSFDASLIVTEEEQAKYKAEYEASKKSKSKTNSIEVKNNETLSI